MIRKAFLESRQFDGSTARSRPSNQARRPWLHIAAIVFWILVSYASIQAPILPFVWLSAVTLVTLAILCFNACSVVIKLVLVNLGAAVVAFGLCEIYLWITTPEKTNTYCCDNAYMIRDDHLGMVPRKNYSATHVKTINSVPIYNVTYTIDGNGLRTAPPYDEQNVVGSVLFFGCSFTIGEGVADHEAMPYVTGILSHGRYAVYNFGFHGYGTQQMLAALESESLYSIVSVPPKYIVYQAIPYHLQRISGLISWFPHAPRYRQAGNGRIMQQGNFDTVTDESRYSRIERFWRSKGSIGQIASMTLRKSFVYNKLVSPFRHLSEEDVQLFLAMVTQSRNAAKLRYPESEFHVLLWDNMFRQRDFLPFLRPILDGLKSQEIAVHLLSNIISDYDGSVPDTRYELDLRDSHPNPLTHRLLASYIASEILR